MNRVVFNTLKFETHSSSLSDGPSNSYSECDSGQYKSGVWANASGRMNQTTSRLLLRVLTMKNAAREHINPNPIITYKTVLAVAKFA